MSWVCVSHMSVKLFFFCKVFEHKLNDASYFEPAVKAPHDLCQHLLLCCVSPFAGRGIKVESVR